MWSTIIILAILPIWALIRLSRWSDEGSRELVERKRKENYKIWEEFEKKYVASGEDMERIRKEMKQHTKRADDVTAKLARVLRIDEYDITGPDGIDMIECALLSDEGKIPQAFGLSWVAGANSVFTYQFLPTSEKIRNRNFRFIKWYNAKMKLKMKGTDPMIFIPKCKARPSTYCIDKAIPVSQCTSLQVGKYTWPQYAYGMGCYLFEKCSECNMGRQCEGFV